MTRVIAIVGSELSPAGVAVLPRSDATAVSLGVANWGECEAVTLRPDAAAVKYALAAGAKGARRAVDGNGLGFDVALLGGAGMGPLGEIVPAKLAMARGAAMVLDVLSVEAARDGLRVVRDLGRGAKEVLIVSLPAVLVMSEDAPRGRYVSRWKRGSAVCETVSGDSRAMDETRGAGWSPAKPRVRTAQLARKTAGSALDRMFDAFGVAEVEASGGGAGQHVVIADAAECARQLVRYLGHHGFIDRASEGGMARDQAEPAAMMAAARGARPHPGPLPGAAGTPLGEGVHAPRAPRSRGGRPSGLHRRPRPYQRPVAPAGGLARRPRPLGLSAPRNLRGPFPLTPQGSPHARV